MELAGAYDQPLLSDMERLVHKASFRHPNFIGLFTRNSVVGLWSIGYRH